MTTVEDNPAAAESRQEPELVAQLSPRWALAPRHLGLLAVFCLLLMILNYLPLRGTDLWGHVAYGGWMLDHHELPGQDPFAPLTTGMRVIDSAWLSQVVFAAVERWGGVEMLSTLFACVSLTTFLILSRACYLQSQRMLIALAGLLIVLVVGFSRITTIRPENFGALAFAVLLWLLVRHGMLSRHLPDNVEPPAAPRSATLWIGVFLVMLLWANFHGSFVCGLAAIGCLLAGRVIEVAWRQRSLSSVLADAEVRRRLVLLELSLAATLINPYGLDLLLNSLGFSNNEVLQDVLEWQPLSLLGVGGREFALSWLLITIVLRHSRQRVPIGEALMLGLFAAATASRVRMIGWYAAVAAVFLAPHLAELWERFAKPVESEPALAPRNNPVALIAGRSWTYSLIALLMIWITFALSPLGRPVVGDEPRKPELLYDRSTPLTASAYLRDNPPTSMVFSPQWWGDWLVWDGPDGLQPFVTTNMHLIPRMVWDDYRRIMASRSGWDDALDRYRVELMILDRSEQSQLERLAERHPQWKVVFEDDQAVILKRNVRRSREEAAAEPDTAKDTDAKDTDAKDTDAKDTDAKDTDAKDGGDQRDNATQEQP